MNRFHKLKDNNSDFPLLDNVKVYQFDNEFDYQRYNSIQMDLQICTVPWDVGEAHVGQRTISGIGNVVWFETKEARNAWFDAIPDDKCYRFSTKYKELHREMTIDVPIPFDMCAKHNYLVVRYNLFANEHSPVEYEGITGLREWFWFIREVEFIAPNNTRLHLLDDAFQTWMYDVTVKGMILERGHAPMFSMKADQFLKDPVKNNEYLLTEDVNYGDATQVKHIDALVLNDGNMYACIATTANPNTDWGTKAANSWHTPASASYTQNGVPSTYVFAVPVASLNTLLANITANYPQFKQTVQGIFFASDDLITITGSFTFAGTACHTISSTRQTFNLSQLEKSQFGYDAKYQDIAKLYTYPYAHIEITDENGQVDIVKIEDSTGTINVSAALSIAYPFITLDAHLLGVGGTPSASITFKNVNARTFNIQGKWYETLKSWNIPTFAVVLDASREYDYSTHFDRAQRVVDYTTEYDNAAALAGTAKTDADARALTTQTNTKNVNTANYNNALASAVTNRDNAKNMATATRDNTYDSADTTNTNVNTMSAAQKSNADAAADTLVSNTALQTAANSSITSTSNLAAGVDVSLHNDLSYTLTSYENNYTIQTANNEVDAAYASAAIGAAGGAISSAASGAMSGASMGPVGAALGAVGGLISGGISAATTMASTTVAANLTSAQASAATSLNTSKTSTTTSNSRSRTANQSDANRTNTQTANTASTGASANSAATEKANASRMQTAQNTTAAATRSTDRGNATRSKNATDAAADNTYNTETANAGRTKTAADNAADNTYNTETAANARDYNTAIANAERTRNQRISSINNDIAQAALRSPFVYGAFQNGESATTKPIALFANIVTQSKSAIASAGDEFLRYGYMFDKQWSFNGNWNVGKHFTYWKLKDFWVYNLNVPDMYMDKLRFFLFGGVTVWRRPEDIGKVSVYDNFS